MLKEDKNKELKVEWIRVTYNNKWKYFSDIESFIIKMFEMWVIINFLFTFLHILSSHEIVVAYNCGSHTNISTKYVKYVSVRNL